MVNEYLAHPLTEPSLPPDLLEIQRICHRQAGRCAAELTGRGLSLRQSPGEAAGALDGRPGPRLRGTVRHSDLRRQRVLRCGNSDGHQRSEME